MTRLMLIINPAAGRGGFRNGLGDALNLLDKGGCRTTLFFTLRPRRRDGVCGEIRRGF